MIDKEKFLLIECYEEFDRRRNEFKELSMADPEIREHVRKIFPKLKNYTEEELYSYLPDGKRVLGGKGNTKKPDNKEAAE